jgi:plasmid replication initiation protein
MEEGGMEKMEEILARFEEKAKEVQKNRRLALEPNNSANNSKGARAQLLPDRHPNRDFFVADILDWALKDDRHTMEHPMFSLSKKPDRKIRHYEHNGSTVTVEPSVRGMATIWDKDILIYAISQLVEAINRGRADINRTIRMTAYDLLVATNRSSGGRAYDLLADAFKRLAGTRINTDIKTNGVRQRMGFGLIDSWEIVEKSPNEGRMVALHVTLSEWLYNAVVGGEVLTLNRDYFRLDGGLERRLYELARKHCGHQAKWVIGMELLHKKSGSQSTLIKFRELVKRAETSDALPDYRIKYNFDGDQVIFYTKDPKAFALSATHS